MPFTTESARSANKVKAAYGNHRLLRPLGFPNLRAGRETQKRHADHKVAIRPDGVWLCACGLGGGRGLQEVLDQHRDAGLRLARRLAFVLLTAGQLNA